MAMENNMQSRAGDLGRACSVVRAVALLGGMAEHCGTVPVLRRFCTTHHSCCFLHR